MAIIRRDFLSGQVKNNPLGVLGTSVLSDQFADIPTLASGHTDTFKIILDPLSQNGDPEIIYVTEHTASSDIVVVSRGQEGTTARDHPLGTSWFHGPTADDWDGFLTPDITQEVDFNANLLTRPRFNNYDEVINHPPEIDASGILSLDFEADSVVFVNVPYRTELTEIQYSNLTAATTSAQSITLVFTGPVSNDPITWPAESKFADGSPPDLLSDAGWKVLTLLAMDPSNILVVSGGLNYAAETP